MNRRLHALLFAALVALPITWFVPLIGKEGFQA